MMSEKTLQEKYLSPQVIETYREDELVGDVTAHANVVYANWSD